MVFSFFVMVVFLSRGGYGENSFDSVYPTGYDPNAFTYDHKVDLDITVDYVLTSEHAFPTLYVNISRSSFYECDTRYFVDFVEPVTPIVVGPELGQSTTPCSNFNQSYTASDWRLGSTIWDSEFGINTTNFTLSDFKFENALRTSCNEGGAVNVREQEVTFMQQSYTQYVYSWKVHVCQVSVLDSSCSSSVSNGVVARTCKAFPATLSLIPSLVTSLQMTNSIYLAAADFFITSFVGMRDDCPVGHERGKTLFTLVLPREFISFSTDNVHRLIKPLAFFKETFRFGDYSNVRWRHVSYLSDFRQLFELEMLTSCYDTGYDVGFRNRPDAFVSSFAPPGTGYAEISFELRALFSGMNVALKLNMLVTPSFFALPTEAMVNSAAFVNHTLHIGYADSVSNAPAFDGYYLRDDYVCSKQQISKGAASLKPARVAFCVLTPEASTNPWVGKVIDISVKGSQRKIMFGCQENSWIDMSGAVLQDGIYTFLHEPVVVKGTHEIILWFVADSDISKSLVPKLVPAEEVGNFLDAFLVYYDVSTQTMVSKSTRGALKLEIYNYVQNIQLNCTNKPQSCNIACFRIITSENALNKKFVVHHDSVAYFPSSAKRRLLSNSDVLQNLKTGTLLLNTKQSNTTITTSSHTLAKDSKLAEIKKFQEETFRRFCVNVIVTIEAWDTTCSPQSRNNMSYVCFNSSRNITNVLMNDSPLSNTCGT